MPSVYADDTACKAAECNSCSKCATEYATAFEAAAYASEALCVADECNEVCSECETNFATSFKQAYHNADQCRAA